MILMLLVLNACSASRFDPSLQYSTDPDYGYSPQEPLVLYTNFEEAASKKANKFFENLRTAKGEKLIVVEMTKVANPNYKKPTIVLYNWITDEQMNKGNGKFLIQYQLKSEGGTDSLQLYVNHFMKGSPLVPNSLFLADDLSTDHLLGAFNR